MSHVETERSLSIASTARVASSAKIGQHVIIDDYAIIEPNVIIGDHCHIKAHSIIRSQTELGSYVTVDSFSVIGGDPQVSNFDRSINSGARIGDHTIIREGVTVHRSSAPNQYTTVGQHGMLMAQCHVAHDCIVGDHVVIVNQVLLGGHVEIGNRVTIGGGARIHQFVRLGDYAMIGATTMISYDIAPAVTATDRNQIHGLNRIGLKRAGFSAAERKQLNQHYINILKSPGNPSELAQSIINNEPSLSPLEILFLHFFTQPSKRGYVRDLNNG